MGVIGLARWSCDGCGKVITTDENANPPGWVTLQAIEMTGNRQACGREFVYFVCVSCWTGAMWVKEGHPSLTSRRDV